MKIVDLPFDGSGLPNVDLVVHYKESPKQVLEAVNQLLVQREMDAQFIAHRSDDDQYYFTLKTMPAGWARLPAEKREAY